MHIKKNKTKENKWTIKKTRELTNFVSHLADDVKAGEKEFKDSYLSSKSDGTKRKKNNTYQNMNVILKNSFTNTSFNSINMISYKFSIAMENSMSDGYLSEKIIGSFISGTIPIYYRDYMIDEFLVMNKYFFTYQIN